MNSHVAAFGPTGCLNKGSVPSELMAIDQRQDKNDRSYLAQ